MYATVTYMTELRSPAGDPTAKYGGPITMIVVGGILLVFSVLGMVFSSLLPSVGMFAAGLGVLGLGIKWLRDRQRDVPDIAYGSEPYGAVDPVLWAVEDLGNRRRNAKRPRSSDRGRS